jgi:hypothetical protein
MRRSLALLGTLILVACTKKDDVAPVDTTTAAAQAPALTIDLAAVAGTWDLQIRGMASDSVVTTGILTATADTAGWVLQLPKRDPLTLRVLVSGDSVVTVAPEYESVLRKGVRVQTTSVYRLVGDNLSGITTATYRGVGPDSVVTLRAVGTRRVM